MIEAGDLIWSHLSLKLLDHVSKIVGERVVITHDLPSAPQINRQSQININININTNIKITHDLPSAPQIKSMIASLWKNNNILLILILLIPINHLCHVLLIINKLFRTSRSVLEIKKQSQLSQFDSRERRGCRVLALGLHHLRWQLPHQVVAYHHQQHYTTTTNTTTTNTTIIGMIITTFSIWQNPSSSAI